MFYGLKTVKQLKKKKYLNYFKFCLYPCTRVTFTQKNVMQAKTKFILNIQLSTLKLARKMRHSICKINIFKLYIGKETFP